MRTVIWCYIRIYRSYILHDASDPKLHCLILGQWDHVSSRLDSVAPGQTVHNGQSDPELR